MVYCTVWNTSTLPPAFLYFSIRVATVFLQEFQQQWRTIIPLCFSIHLSTILYCIVWNTSTLPPALLQFSYRSFSNNVGLSFHCASVYTCLPLSTVFFETQVHYRPHLYLSIRIENAFKTQVIHTLFSTQISISQSPLVTDNALNCSVTHLPVYL